MERMNLFSDAEAKSSEELFGDNKSKTNTKPKETTNQLPLAPIQDEKGNIIFSLEGRTFSLNVNSEDERKRVKKEVNTNSLVKYDWFKEETGENHWVFYNTKMYEVVYDRLYCRYYLHYKEDCDLNPVIPINATSCYFMFYDCYALTQLDLSNFDTSSVTEMNCMFSCCKALTQLDLSNFDTSKVTNMSYMFEYCTKLIQLDLSNFNTSQVNSMRFMFGYCKALTQLDFSSFDTSKVIYMDSMFRGCESLTQLDLSGFITSKVTDMSYMFYRCSNLMQLDLSSFNTGKVIYMWRMFYKCKTLIQLDLSNFDTSKVFNMCSMFKECKALTTIYISDKWKTNKAIEDAAMFNDCYSLPDFSPEKTDIEMAKPVEDGGYLTLKK